jgi:NAD(P)-dependent dehydrogenase (short-subunit alcohol dehydrogenase family)
MRMEQLFNVTDHVALVTGAASGIGFAMAEVMAQNGARVVMVDVNADGLNQAAETLRNAHLEVECVVADVADSDRISQVIDAAATKHGRLDAVFANAGMSSGPGYASSPAGQIEANSLTLWDKVLQVNLTGVFVTMRAAAAHMKRQRSGRIIVTSSSAGLKAEPIVGYGYVATKAAVANLVRQAALELAPYNVMVNGICPAGFITNIAGGRMHRDPEARQQMISRVPLGRLATADEIQGLALLLASPASSFITGALISIDGGATAG